jgi:tryptophanyl-tRNA synthetase
MSKSRNNAVMLSADEDETARLIKKAKTDSERTITFDPVKRPEVSNLLLIASLATGRSPAEIAGKSEKADSGKLKAFLTDS